MTNIEKLRALEKKATPGPWDFHEHRCKVRDANFQTVSDCYGDAERMVKNGIFIVALRNAAPALLDEIERLREEVARLKRVVELDEEIERRHAALSKRDGK